MTDSDHSANRGRPVNESARHERRQKILFGARACFVKRGFHASSMSEISAAAGVSPANIYQYFGNKDALILALIEEGIQADVKLIRRISLSDLRPETIRAMLEPLFLTDEGFDLAVLRCEIMSEASRNPTIGEIAVNAEIKGLDAIASGVRNAQTNGMIPSSIDADHAAALISFVFDGLLRHRTLPGYHGEKLMEEFLQHLGNILHLQGH